MGAWLEGKEGASPRCLQPLPQKRQDVEFGISFVICASLAKCLPGRLLYKGGCCSIEQTDSLSAGIPVGMAGWAAGAWSAAQQRYALHINSDN